MKLLALSAVFIVLLQNVKGQSGTLTSANGILTRIGFDQLNDVAEEGETNTFVKIRIFSGPLSEDITGNVVPMTVEQLESYVFTTFRTIPPELWEYIDNIEDPAEYEEGASERKDFNNSIISFTIPAGDEEYDVPTSDIIVDDSLSEASEDFILVLDNVEPADRVDLDNLFEGILVFTITDNDDSCEECQILTQTVIIAAAAVALIIVIAVTAGVVILLISFHKLKKKDDTDPQAYEYPMETVNVGMGMSRHTITTVGNTAYGAQMQPEATFTNIDEVYEDIEQRSAARTPETPNIGYEVVEEQDTPAEMDTDRLYEN